MKSWDKTINFKQKPILANDTAQIEKMNGQQKTVLGDQELREWISRIFSSKQFSYLISPIQHSCSFISKHIGKSLRLWIEKPASSIQGHVIF